MKKKTFLLIAIIILVRIFWINYISTDSFKMDLKLPAGEGKQDFIHTCSTCHLLEIALHPKKDFKNWKDVIIWMNKMQGMGKLEKKKEDNIIHYLEEHFPLEADLDDET